jgi:hypothetical protein
MLLNSCDDESIGEAEKQTRKLYFTLKVVIIHPKSSPFSYVLDGVIDGLGAVGRGEVAPTADSIVSTEGDDERTRLAPTIKQSLSLHSLLL